MSTCEKCWSDAFRRAQGTGKAQAVHYAELITERIENPCTPEQQAGTDASICPSCNRKTIHLHTGECMNPECKGDRL